MLILHDLPFYNTVVLSQHADYYLAIQGVLGSLNEILVRHIPDSSPISFKDGLNGIGRPAIERTNVSCIDVLGAATAICGLYAAFGQIVAAGICEAASIYGYLKCIAVNGE